MKLQEEIKSRKVMDKKVFEIAMENVDKQNPQQIELLKEIRTLQEVHENKNRAKKFNSAYSLLKEKKNLLERLKAFEEK